MSKQVKIAALTVGVALAAFTIANSTLQSQPLPSTSTTSLPPIGLLPKPAQIVVEGVTKKAVTIANPRQAEGLTFFVTDVATSSRGVILSVPEFGPSGTIIFGGETGSGGGFRTRFLNTPMPFSTSADLRLDIGGPATVILSGYWSTQQPDITTIDATP